MTSADLEWAESILGAVGTVVRVTERNLDAVTGLSGPMPAYLYLVVEALVEAGVHQGLAREVARTLVVDTFAGAAALLQQSGESPEAAARPGHLAGRDDRGGAARPREPRGARRVHGRRRGGRRAQSPVGSLRPPAVA